MIAEILFFRALSRPFARRIPSMIIFAIHFFISMLVLILGGLATEGRYFGGTFSAADAFRYMGYLPTLLLAVMFFLCLSLLKGGFTLYWFWIAEFIAFPFQILAWILDAVNANKLNRGSRHNLAAASAVFGFFGCIFTLWVAFGLFIHKEELSNMCGGSTECCGVQDVEEGESPSDAVQVEEGVGGETNPNPSAGKSPSTQ